jgi:hypothetical protein
MSAAFVITGPGIFESRSSAAFNDMRVELGQWNANPGGFVTRYQLAAAARQEPSLDS